MPLYKDEAIVLFKRAYGESDRIIRLFTFRSGKLSAIAKGAGKSQKRFMNTLELFNHISLEYFDKNRRGLVRIENADIVETNGGIEKSLKRACIAGFFAEFVDRLTKEREPHIRLFHLLSELLKKVKSAEPDHEDLLYYQLRMLDVLGFMPNLESCVHCGKIVSETEKIYFSNEKGGIICMPCSGFIPHKRFEKGVVSALSSIGKRDKRDAGYYDVSARQEAQVIMDDFIFYHLDVEFKSYALLRKVL